MSYTKYPPAPPSRRAFWVIVVVCVAVVILSYAVRTWT